MGKGEREREGGGGRKRERDRERDREGEREDRHQWISGERREVIPCARSLNQTPPSYLRGHEQELSIEIITS